MKPAFANDNFAVKNVLFANLILIIATLQAFVKRFETTDSFKRGVVHRIDERIPPALATWRNFARRERKLFPSVPLCVIYSMVSYNTRLLFESQEHFSAALKMLEAERDVFNFCSKKIFKHKLGNIVEVHSACYKKFRKLRPKIPAQVVIRGEKSCISAYASMRSNHHDIDEAAVKKGLSMRLDKRLFLFVGKTAVKLTTIDAGRIIAKMELYPRLESLINTYSVTDPLIFERDGEIWISLTFKTPEVAAKDGEALGIDLGVKRPVATSSGIIYKDAKFNKERRRLRFLKRQLEACNSESAKRHLKKLRRKERNKSKNQTHLLVNSVLALDAQTYVLEDLADIKPKTAKKNKKDFGPVNGARINNKVSQVPFFLFKEILTYKAQALGKRVVTVNPFETSKRDHRTGEKSGIRKGCRYYAHDGIVFDSDCNAAVNIVRRSKLPFSPGNVLDGQATVSSPTVSKLGLNLINTSPPL